jgi:pimeloyl-ACP methyl ester carboxylesterase
LDDQKPVSLLAPLHGRKPEAPAWFTRALAVAPERAFVAVAAARIEMLTWGERGKPGLLLLHGNGAHADWWSFIAPFFSEHYRVAALSWSGMGASDWRERYSLDAFLAEIETVAEAAGLYDAPEKPVAVGHSFGAMPLLIHAARNSERLKAIVIVDPPIFSPTRERQNRPPREHQAHRVYPSLEAALARFRFAPVQGCENLYIADFIARTSLKTAPMTEGPGEGWTWRFDPALWRTLSLREMLPKPGDVRCPSALIWGGRSRLMRPEDAAHALTLLPPGSPSIDIPEAEHHVWIDQPLAFVAALRALLAAWPAKEAP